MKKNINKPSIEKRKRFFKKKQWQINEIFVGANQMQSSTPPATTFSTTTVVSTTPITNTSPSLSVETELVIAPTQEKQEPVKEVTPQLDDVQLEVSEELEKPQEILTEASIEETIEDEMEDLIIEVEDEAVEAIAEVAEDNQFPTDDLTILKGIGKVLTTQLQESNITSFRQLAELTEEDFEALNEKINGFKAKYERYDWKKQAEEQL